MVYCWKCGAENEEDAVNCAKCGANLSPPPRRVSYRRSYEDDLCYGPRRGASFIGIFFGILIILAGVISLLEHMVWWATWDRLWPILIVAFGLFIIASALYRR